jgi:hypothetical protein
MKIEKDLQEIEFYKLTKNASLASRMRRLNEQFGIELRSDNDEGEERGFIGNYTGDLKGTPFGVNYTVEDNVRIEEMDNNTRHYITTIHNIDFENPECIRMLIKDPYVMRVAEIYNEKKSLENLHDEIFVEGALDQMEEERLKMSSPNDIQGLPRKV